MSLKNQQHDRQKSERNKMNCIMAVKKSKMVKNHQNHFGKKVENQFMVVAAVRPSIFDNRH